MRRIRIFVLLLLVPLSSGAQTASIVARSIHAFGTTTIATRDSVQLVQAGKDTSGTFEIGGIDFYRHFTRVRSTNDSINIIIYLDISPDGDVNNWILWGGLDTLIVSGTTDTLAYVEIPTPPYSAQLGRIRTNSATAAGDTVKIWHRETLTRIGLDRFR